MMICERKKYSSKWLKTTLQQIDVCFNRAFNACVASGGWVPMGQGAATAITPQSGRTLTGLPTRNPATLPHYSTRHNEARSPVEVKCTNPRNKGKKQKQKKSGAREGNQEKRYATRTPRH